MSPTNMSGKRCRKKKKVNKKRKKSGKKYKKLYEWCVSTLKKQKRKSKTKWIENEKEKIAKRMRKYNLPERKVQDYIEDKGLDELVDMVDFMDYIN